MRQRAWEHRGERQYIEGIPFGYWIETGDHYIAHGPMSHLDVPLASIALEGETAEWVGLAQDLLANWDSDGNRGGGAEYEVMEGLTKQLTRMFLALNDLKTEAESEAKDSEHFRIWVIEFIERVIGNE